MYIGPVFVPSIQTKFDAPVNSNSASVAPHASATVVYPPPEIGIAEYPFKALLLSQ